MNKPELAAGDLTLFVSWQDPISRLWHVVGRLTRTRGEYRFSYTRGAKASKSFVPFGQLTQLDTEYRSRELLPLFSNRVLPRSRPDYDEYLRWLELSSVDADPLVVLGRTGGLKTTDSLSIYPLPKPDVEGNYRVLFFCHGLRHVAEPALQRILNLQRGDCLYPMLDVQNANDRDAIALRSDAPAALLGYCPRFFARDFATLLHATNDAASISVIRVNNDAPIQLRLLCEFRSLWPDNFWPCQGDEYKSLAKNLSDENVQM
jgi:hypothetical protein